MDELTDPKEKARDLGINPNDLDFTLTDEELKNISAGGAAGCAKIGALSTECTGTGLRSDCTEIGIANAQCTKTGL